MAMEKEVDMGGDVQHRETEPAAEASTFMELGIFRELVEACDAVWKQPTNIQAGATPSLEGTSIILYRHRTFRCYTTTARLLRTCAAS
jgi:hypothetical protein